jgi:hypothetical protein
MTWDSVTQGSTTWSNIWFCSQKANLIQGNSEEWTHNKGKMKFLSIADIYNLTDICLAHNERGRKIIKLNILGFGLCKSSEKYAIMSYFPLYCAWLFFNFLSIHFYPYPYFSYSLLIYSSTLYEIFLFLIGHLIIAKDAPWGALFPIPLLTYLINWNKLCHFMQVLEYQSWRKL